MNICPYSVTLCEYVFAPHTQFLSKYATQKIIKFWGRRWVAVWEDSHVSAAVSFPSGILSSLLLAALSTHDTCNAGTFWYQVRHLAPSKVFVSVDVSLSETGLFFLSFGAFFTYITNIHKASNNWSPPFGLYSTFLLFGWGFWIQNDFITFWRVFLLGNMEIILWLLWYVMLPCTPSSIPHACEGLLACCLASLTEWWGFLQSLTSYALILVLFLPW